MRLNRFGSTVMLSAALAAGCAPTPKVDYNTFRANLPASILVLPPVNRTVEVDAPYRYLSTISQPLAENGYYVFPVAVVDTYMKENGLHTPDDMHAVALDKLAEVFGPDAVLYLTIIEYGQKFQIITSTTVVKVEATLVDAATGVTLWEGTAQVTQSSDGSSAGLLGMIIVAAMSQIFQSISDHAHTLSTQANIQLITAPHSGLLLGPYHPEHENDQRGR